MMTSFDELLRDLITANHILHYHGVVDAYGHISVRHPEHPDIFIMSGNMAPALVSSPDDLVQYRVKDASAVDPNAPRGYIERYIHSEIFRRFPEVNSVVHSHADDVLPYAVSGVALTPMYHMAGFLGSKVPVYDIEHSYQAGDPHDLLIRSEKLGADLASSFSASSSESSLPDYKVVLMRGHGFTTYGPDIKTAVYRAVFTKNNAKIQTTSALLRQAYQGMDAGASSGYTGNHELAPLTSEQARDAEAANAKTVERPWGLWVKEVQSQQLYSRRFT